MKKVKIEKSCEQRIDKELRGRIKDFRHALKEDWKYFDDYEYEDFGDWLNQTALAYSDSPHYRAKCLELSCGGPQDYFLFFEDGTIEYHFLDWFDGAKRILEGDEYDTMKQVVDWLGVGEEAVC